MQTNPINGSVPVQKPVTPPPTVKSAKEDRDDVNVSQSLSLQKALDESPAVRVEKVEKARELVGDVNYPPHEAVVKIAHLLAAKWPPNQEFQDE